MDLFNRLFNPRRRRGGNNDSMDTLRGASRWILGCGCALVVALVFVVILIANGTITVDDETLTVGVVIAMIVVAVISLIRTTRS